MEKFIKFYELMIYYIFHRVLYSLHSASPKLTFDIDIVQLQK